MHRTLIVRSSLVTVCAIALVSLAGCGSDDDKGTSADSAAPTAKESVPKALYGTYTTTLKSSDVPAGAAPELTDGSMTWKLTLAPSGGATGGPAFTIANAKLGVLESPSFKVENGHVVLAKEECAAGGTEHFYDNEYAYRLAANKLEFKEVKNSCPDKVALTILTSRPWQGK